jgi:hypothetical protein
VDGFSDCKVIEVMSLKNSLSLVRSPAPFRRARLCFSNNDEERILRRYIEELLPPNHSGVAIDLGAGDGVRHSNTHALFISGWQGLAVDADSGRVSRLARTYRDYPSVYACRCHLTPHNVVSLLEAYEVSTEFEVLSLDIDSYDYCVLDALLARFRPRIIVTEINEKIPPPIRFAVRYDPHFVLQHHFFGYSIASLEDLCDRYDYALIDLEYNNAFIAPRELPGVRSIDAVTAYRRGYLERPDRRKKFRLNLDMEPLQSMSPAEGMAFLDQFFARHKGKYELSATNGLELVHEVKCLK